MNTSVNKENIDTANEEGAAGVTLDLRSSEEMIAKTPESMPPPLSCSTIELSMTARRKKKLFTEKFGPQEFE